MLIGHPAKVGKQPDNADRTSTKYIKSLHPFITLLHVVCANPAKPAIPAKPAKIGQDYVIFKQASSDSHSFSCHHSKNQHLLSTHTHINKYNTAEWTPSISAISTISTIPAKSGWNFVIYKPILLHTPSLYCYPSKETHPPHIHSLKNKACILTKLTNILNKLVRLNKNLYSLLTIFIFRLKNIVVS